MSQLSTGKKVAVDYEDKGRTIWSHYMMYGEDFKLFIADSQTPETRDKVKEFCPEYDLIFIDGDHSYDGVRRDFELYQEIDYIFSNYDKCFAEQVSKRKEFLRKTSWSNAASMIAACYKTL